jgi:hypothetical protein
MGQLGPKCRWFELNPSFPSLGSNVVWEIMELEILEEPCILQEWERALNSQGSLHIEPILLFWVSNIWNECLGSPKASWNVALLSWKSVSRRAERSHVQLGSWTITSCTWSDCLAKLESRHEKLAAWISSFIYPDVKFPCWQWQLSQLFPRSPETSELFNWCLQFIATSSPT